MEDFQRTIISQYASSPTLVQLITNFNGYLDPSPQIDQFYDLVFNLDTAEGYGLDRWGRIVGVSRQLTVPVDIDYFGFSAALGEWSPFGEEAFFTGVPLTENYVLSDDAYRQLILIKAAANIARTSMPELNRLLTTLFEGRGRAYVSNLGNMQMRYTFEFYLQPFERSIITQSGVMPRPTGVGVYFLEVPEDTFGFAEAGDALPFNDGTFLSPGVIDVS